MLSTNQGFTLIEIMIALVVALILFMGLMQTSLIGIDSNMRNVLRNAAFQIAENQISQAKLSSYPPTAPSGPPVTVDFRNVTGFPYTVGGAVTQLDVNPNCNSRLTVTVQWSWKGQIFSLTTSDVIRNEGNSQC